MQRITVITGAANGIGRRLALDLIAGGADIVIACDIDARALQQTFAGSTAHVYPLDVTQPDEWRQLRADVVGEYGRIDLLCNVAGVIIPGWIEDVDLADVDKHIDVNVKGVMYGTHVAARQMVDQGSGHIINIASLAGVAFTPGNSIYAGSKHAVRGFSVSAALELRPKGVHVSCICPGVVNTQMLDVQLHRDEAALTFSTGAPLSPADISLVIQRAMARKPLEILVPNILITKIVNMFPRIGFWLQGIFLWRGRRNAMQLRGRKS